MSTYTQLAKPADTVLLVVDFQEKLLPAMSDALAITAGAGRLIRAAGVLGVPIVVTEQYPAGLGPTVTELGELLGDAPVVAKKVFSACVPEVRDHLQKLARPIVVVVGIEAHVCVQQSVLDLLAAGYAVYVCADAVGSRREPDCRTALDRIRQAGAIVTTTESVIFELLGEAGTESFKRILAVVK